jgi:hypothetical protein
MFGVKSQSDSKPRAYRSVAIDRLGGAYRLVERSRPSPPRQHHQQYPQKETPKKEIGCDCQIPRRACI